MRALLVVTIALLAGCTSHESVMLVFDEGSENLVKHLDCGNSGSFEIVMLVVNVGSARVDVLDSNHNPIFAQTFSQGMHELEETALIGAPGEWTLRVTPEGTTLEDFDGGGHLSLRCRV